MKITITSETGEDKRERLGRRFVAVPAYIAADRDIDPAETYSVLLVKDGVTIDFRGVRPRVIDYRWFMDLRTARTYSVMPSMEIEFI